MYQAVENSEQNLLRLATERFAELKKQIKKEAAKKHEVPCQIENKPKDSILDATIENILNSVEVEQIYAFHQITYGEKQPITCCLLPIPLATKK